jgi:hypothetical protein
MLNTSNNHLIALLANAGLNVDRLDDIVIDTFDQWTTTNSADALIPSCAACTATIDIPLGAAA